MHAGRGLITDASHRKFEKITLPGSLEQWEYDHRARIGRAAWRALKIIVSGMLYLWALINLVGFIFAAGCTHGACTQPGWWSSWVMFPSRALLEYLKAVVQ